MRMTVEEIRDTGINIKSWLGEMQRAAKGPEGPSFPLKGPCTLSVRKRRVVALTASTSTSMHAFMGGEEFRIGGIVAENLISEDAIDIRVTLIPAKMALAAEMSGMTLAMDKCVEYLEGFEEWMGSFSEAMYAQSKTARPVPVAEQREANTMWGSW